MSDEELKRLLQEEMIREAEQIMAEVNADPTLKDVKCPEEVHDKVFEQIRIYEEEKAKTYIKISSIPSKEFLNQQINLVSIAKKRMIDIFRD